MFLRMCTDEDGRFNLPLWQALALPTDCGGVSATDAFDLDEVRRVAALERFELQRIMQALSQNLDKCPKCHFYNGSHTPACLNCKHPLKGKG